MKTFFTYIGPFAVGPDPDTAGAWRIYRYGKLHNTGPLYDRDEAERVAYGLAEDSGWCPECGMGNRRHMRQCCRVS